jgi:hypothetical protein
MELSTILTIIAFLIIVLLIVFFVIWQIKKNGLKKFIIEQIVYAEEVYTDNKVKFESVVNQVINKLPFPFNLIPVTVIENLVQTVFDNVKIALNYKGDE